MRNLFITIFFLLPGSIVAQISIEDFLYSATTDPAFNVLDAQEKFLQAKPYQLSPIQKLEFRTESNQLDRTRQDYALRINPANPWENRRTTLYFKTYQELLQLDRSRVLKEMLLARYVAIVNWATSMELKSLKEAEKKSNENAIAILEGQQSSTAFDADLYIKLKLDQIEKTVEYEEANLELDNQTSIVESLHSATKLTPVNWLLKSFISLASADKLIDTLSANRREEGELAYQKKKIELLESEWRLKKSNINVGYVQTKYENFRIQQGREPWSISLGVAIPIFNPNKGDMAKRRLDVYKAEGNLAKSKDEQQLGIDLSKTKAKSILKRYYQLTTMMDTLQLSSLGDLIQQQDKGNPINKVRYEANLIKLKMAAVKLKQQFYLTYFEILSHTDQIQQKPLLNYLSPVLSELLLR
jgi:hypothetical protein